MDDRPGTRWAGGAHPPAPGLPLVVAHRGASAAQPENTVAAFRAARALGADWVELDVHLLADGALAVHHDPVLRDGRPLAGLRARDLPPGVPLLPEAFDACAGMGVNVEVKGDGGAAVAAAGAVVALVGRSPLAERVLVSSFDWRAVDQVRAAAPWLATGLLAFVVPDPAGLVAAAARRGCAAVHPHAALVDGCVRGGRPRGRVGRHRVDRRRPGPHGRADRRRRRRHRHERSRRGEEGPGARCWLSRDR